MFEPRLSESRVRLAVPELLSDTGSPTSAPPTSNWTEPVGTGIGLPACGVAVAVSVMDSPDTEVAGEAVTVVVVASC